MNSLLIIFFITYGVYSLFYNIKFLLIYFFLLGLYIYFTQIRTNNYLKERLRRKMSICTWGPNYDPQTYTSLKLDITNILPYLEKISQEIGEHITPTIYSIKLMAIILKKYPEVYGYIRFGRYEPKDGVDICCLVQVDKGNELANTTIVNCEQKNFKQIAKELNESVLKLRQRKNKGQNKKMKICKLLPTFLLGPISQVSSYLSSVGIKLGFIDLKKFEFGSCVVTSVGSLGIENSFAPIPPITFVPILLTLGKMYDKNIKNEKGEVEKRKLMKFNFTTDYRFFDVKNACGLFNDLKKVGEDPELFRLECEKYEKIEKISENLTKEVQEVKETDENKKLKEN